MAQLLGIHLFYFSVASRMDCLDTQRALGLGRSVQLREPFVDALRMSNGVYSLQFVCCDSILTLRITLYWWSKDQERLLCDWTLNMWPGQHFSGLLCSCNSEFSSIDCGGQTGDPNSFIGFRAIFQPSDYLPPIGKKKISKVGQVTRYHFT